MPDKDRQVWSLEQIVQRLVMLLDAVKGLLTTIDE